MNYLNHIAGNCFNHRTNDLCYELTDMNTNEDQCTSAFYSDDSLQELDGHIYAEQCRDVNRKVQLKFCE